MSVPLVADLGRRGSVLRVRPSSRSPLPNSFCGPPLRLRGGTTDRGRPCRTVRADRPARHRRAPRPAGTGTRFLRLPAAAPRRCARGSRAGARASGAGGGQVEFGDGAFHDDVACGVPARNVHVRAGVEVQEHVVQHDVQVGASEFGRFRGVEARERCGVEADVKAVGGQRGIAHGERAQARERSVHEAQVHEQRVFARSSAWRASGSTASTA